MDMMKQATAKIGDDRDETARDEMGQDALPAEACRTMADVRREIDRIDALLVALMAERQTFIEAAGRIKQERGTVRDEARIAEVIAHVRALAEARGLNPDIAEPVWRALIEASIAHEYDVFDKLKED